MQPKEVKYKCNDPSRPMRGFRSYSILPKGSWTSILAEHFWEHTHLPCCLSFRNGKVYNNGNIYVIVIGRCTVCNSNFKGIVTNKPSVNAR